MGEHYWGPGTSAFRLYQNLKGDESVELHLAHGFGGQKQYDLFSSQHFIAEISKKTAAQTISFLFKSYLWIRKNVRDFDVVHVLGAHHISFMPALWIEKQGVAAYIKILGEQAGFSGSSRLSKLLFLSAYRRKYANEISGYISISAAIKRELLDANIHPNRIHDIPNGVNTEKFKPATIDEKKQLKRELGISAEFVVLFTGGISKRKNPYLLAKCFSELALADATLLLVGPKRSEDGESEKLLELIEKTPNTDIQIFDHQKEIAPFYQIADLFVLLSENEGLSNSLLEACSAGLPCLVTKISGSEDVIEAGRNGHFSTLDPADVKQGLAYYHLNKAKRKEEGDYARDKIVKSYDVQEVLRLHLDLFKSEVVG